jgi:hypothetical protein
MVLIGHSMGGILSRLMIQSSDGSLWPESIVNDTALRELVRFEPVPSVARVIFMATPHRGAFMAESLIGRLGAMLVSFPGYFVQRVTEAMPDVGIPWESIPTGIDNLVPASRFMRRFNQLPMSSRVPFHSIIGNDKTAGVRGGSDGVVAYRSAHLDGSRSEVVVKSGHSVQQSPLATEEVRRILMLHVRGDDQ